MFSKFLDPKNDIAFRHIFGQEKHKPLLIHFLNDILEKEGQQKIKTVYFIDPHQMPEIASRKESIVDILCRDLNGVQYIVEMQVAKTPGFEKRAQYYAAKAYTSQMKRGGLYQDLKEVIFLAISDYVMFPQQVAYKSRHTLLNTETYTQDLRDFSFIFLELPKFTKKLDEVKTLEERWCYFFKHADTANAKEIAKLIEDAPIINEALEALDGFYWDEQELLIYEDILKRDMDNRAAELYRLETAEREGIEKGIEKGIEQGMKEGRYKANLETAQQGLAKGLPVALISEITDLEVEEITLLSEASSICTQSD